MVDALAEAGDGRAALDLGDAVAGDVCDQQAGRVGPDVDDGDAHGGRGYFGGAGGGTGAGCGSGSPARPARRLSTAMCAMRVRAVWVAEPMCGTTRRLGAVEERVVGRQRFGVGDVECGGGEAPVVEGGGERLLVDEPAAAGVDEDRAGLDRVQGGVVDQVVGLRRERGVE